MHHIEAMKSVVKCIYYVVYKFVYYWTLPPVVSCTFNTTAMRIVLAASRTLYLRSPVMSATRTNLRVVLLTGEPKAKNSELRSALCNWMIFFVSHLSTTVLLIFWWYHSYSSTFLTQLTAVLLFYPIAGAPNSDGVKCWIRCHNVE